MRREAATAQSDIDLLVAFSRLVGLVLAFIRLRPRLAEILGRQWTWQHPSPCALPGGTVSFVRPCPLL